MTLKKVGAIRQHACYRFEQQEMEVDEPGKTAGHLQRVVERDDLGGDLSQDKNGEGQSDNFYCKDQHLGQTKTGGNHPCHYSSEKRCDNSGKSIATEDGSKKPPRLLQHPDHHHVRAT